MVLRVDTAVGVDLLARAVEARHRHPSRVGRIAGEDGGSRDRRDQLQQLFVAVADRRGGLAWPWTWMLAWARHDRRGRTGLHLRPVLRPAARARHLRLTQTTPPRAGAWVSVPVVMPAHRLEQTKGQTRLAKMRVARGMTQREVWEATGISRTTHLRLERGGFENPPVRALSNCAIVLGCELEELIEPEWRDWLDFGAGAPEKPGAV